MSAAAEGQKLSTSALAKALEIPLQQLFVTLRDYGWIRKVDDGWLLTAKGEFEGGEYVHSRRYGRYIVWPPTLLEHALLRGLESNRFLSDTQIGRHYHIGARLVRRLFGELGLLRRDFNGWSLTRRGELAGGIEIHEDGDSAIHWPQALLEDALVARQLEYGRRLHESGGEQQPDLLQPVNDFRGLDGHHFHTRGEWLICDWLYLAGIAHACGRVLPLGRENAPRADFWLPAGQIYIECCGDENDGAALGASLERLEIYRQQHWPCIEVHMEQLADLDDYLTAQLRRFGVQVL